MKFDFKKIASVFASAVMLGSTAGIALAANYPAPLVTGGAGDGAIVITSGNHPGSQVDFWAAVDLQTNLQGVVTASGVTTSTSVTGEAFPLFTSGSKIYYNDSVNVVKQILTDVELPTILADTSFSGNVDADTTQTLSLTSWPYVTFDKMPTGDEDPAIGLLLFTTKGKDLYNATITFDKAVNFTHADSEGETITLFGQKFTVGSATDEDELFLFKSSQTLQLAVGGSAPNPSATVTVEGKDYTVELTAATDTSATIRVTDSTGKFDTKEINEAQSKKILDLEVAINLADESTATNSISAEVTVGAQKVKLQQGNEVKLGSTEDSVEGTNVDFVTTAYPGNITKILIQVAAQDSDLDAIIPGQVFVDPIFGTFKVDFSGINIAEDSTARENIEIKTTQDSATLKMKAHTGDEKTITWYNNESGKNPGGAVLADANGDLIRVIEMAAVNKSEYAVVGNEEEGYLIEVVNIENETTASEFTKDVVELRDIFSEKKFTATITAEGQGTVTIGGKEYTVYYYADKNLDKSAWYVRLNYPDSTTANTHAVIFPTIQTSKGAKVAFYQPTSFNITNWDGRRAGTYVNLTRLKFPDGDGYQDLDFASSSTGDGAGINWTWTLSGIGSGQLNNTNNAGNSSIVNVTHKSGSYVLSYNITSSGNNNITVFLLDPKDDSTEGSLGLNVSGNIIRPALIVFEEEDDNDDLHAVIVEMEGAGSSSDEVGVNNVYYTGGDGGRGGMRPKTLTDFKQMETDDDLYKYVDLWGTITTVDKSESSQYTATISYPDEQIYAQIYAAELSASISGGGVTGGGGQILIVKDTEVNSVSGRNLVVVGGSCINSAAAKILGVSTGTCGSDFTAKTKVGPGQYLIKAVASPYNAEKTAVLVAGYEAADTKNAAAKLKESHDTTINTEKVYPITSA